MGNQKSATFENDKKKKDLQFSLVPPSLQSVKTPQVRSAKNVQVTTHYVFHSVSC